MPEEMKRAQAAAAANTAAGGSAGQAQKSAAGGGPPQLVKVPVAQGSSPAHGVSASTLKSPQVFAMLCTCLQCYQIPCQNWHLCCRRYCGSSANAQVISQSNAIPVISHVCMLHHGAICGFPMCMLHQGAICWLL